MYKLLSLTVFAVAAVPAPGQVVSYEATSFPESEGWTRDVDCTPERWLANGWFHQFVEEDASECGKGEAGDRDRYRRTLESFVGIDRFFVEWRMEATGPNSELDFTAPASMVAGSNAGVNYHFTISRDLVRIIRDNLLPILLVEIVPQTAHTYRVGLDNDPDEPRYATYIDGQLIDAGIAEGVYPPALGPIISWRSFVWFTDSESRWDYVRYGRTPADNSADFDSDGEVNEYEVPFIAECIERSANGENAAPSCSWADTDGDGSVTCDTDWATIAETLWTGPNPPPEIAACVGAAPIPAVSDWGVGILLLLTVTAATLVYGRGLCEVRCERT